MASRMLYSIVALDTRETDRFGQGVIVKGHMKAVRLWHPHCPARPAASSYQSFVRWSAIFTDFALLILTLLTNFVLTDVAIPHA